MRRYLDDWPERRLVACQRVYRGYVPGRRTMSEYGWKLYLDNLFGEGTYP